MSGVVARLKTILGVIVIIGALISLAGMIVAWCQTQTVDTGPVFEYATTKLYLIGLIIAVALNVLMYLFDCMHYAIPSLAILTHVGPRLFTTFRHHDWNRIIGNPNAPQPQLLFFIGTLIAFCGWFITLAAMIPYAEHMIPRVQRLLRPGFVVAFIVLALTWIGGIWCYVNNSFMIHPMFWGFFFFIADVWHLDYLQDAYSLPIGAFLWAIFNEYSLIKQPSTVEAPLIITYIGLCIGVAWMLVTLMIPALREVGFSNFRSVTVAPAGRVKAAEAPPA